MKQMPISQDFFCSSNSTKFLQIRQLLSSLLFSTGDQEPELFAYPTQSPTQSIFLHNFKPGMAFYLKPILFIILNGKANCLMNLSIVPIANAISASQQYLFIESRCLFISPVKCFLTIIVYLNLLILPSLLATSGIQHMHNYSQQIEFFFFPDAVLHGPGCLAKPYFLHLPFTRLGDSF